MYVSISAQPRKMYEEACMLTLESADFLKLLKLDFNDTILDIFQMIDMPGCFIINCFFSKTLAKSNVLTFQSYYKQGNWTVCNLYPPSDGRITSL